MGVRRALNRWRNQIENGTVVLCGICGGRIHPGGTPYLGEVTADHIIPINLGGRNWEANLQPAHRKCNSHKGNNDKYVPTGRHIERIRRAYGSEAATLFAALGIREDATISPGQGAYYEEEERDEAQSIQTETLRERS